MPPRSGYESAGDMNVLAAWSAQRVDDALVRQYLTSMNKTTVSTKGQIVIPSEIREQDGIEPGQVFEIERIDRGEYRLLRQSPATSVGAIDWLLSCPEKDFFATIGSESTDTLAPPAGHAKR
jgi:AbrB family looped-hinge helix DNA binding protein